MAAHPKVGLPETLPKLTRTLGLRDTDPFKTEHGRARCLGPAIFVLAGDDPGDVFLQFIVVFGLDQVLPAFDGKDDLDVDLSVGG